MSESASLGARRLNHVEFAHRPGESGLVVALFEALGCACHSVESPPFGRYVVVTLDGSPHGENDVFVSEAEPEQLALERALQAQLASGPGELASAAEQLRRLQRERPYRATHVGLRVPSVAALDAVIDQLAVLGDGALAGRLELGAPLRRSAREAREMSAPLKQVWIWTDVISTGLLALGQQIELQAYDEP